MESYSEFMQRISSFETSDFRIDIQNFSPSQSVYDKVNLDNSFKPFFGDTVVFDLEEDYKAKINHIINILYSEAPLCFCKRLNPQTIHMTLHDLSNGPNHTRILPQLKANYQKILKYKKAGLVLPDLSIKMATNNIINMVNTSVVLCLYPMNEEEYKKLMHLYELMDDIVQLPYKYTPHITLAYYSRNGFCSFDATNLTQIINQLNLEPFIVSVNTDYLFYQRFYDMNNFVNLSKLY